MKDSTGDGSAADGSVRSGIPGPASWRRLRLSDWVAPSTTILLLLLLTVPRLPPGVCFGDGGDLQLASATSGIMHPCGYAGYVTIGWIVSRVPGVEPAYMVSVACLLSGLGAIWLCMLMQIRLGVSAWIAGAVGLSLTAHPCCWTNLVAPEVYAPTLALLAGAAYLVVRSERTGSRGAMGAAAGLYGLALANRPSLAFMVPFFFAAWWLARRKWDRTLQRLVGSLGLSAACLLLPLCYSLAYLWVRDRPDVTCNYIEQHNAGMAALPESTDGWRAKLDRVVWQASGAQFRGLMGTTKLQARIKWLWLRNELLSPQRQDVLAIIGLIVLFGAIMTWQRSRIVFVLLIGFSVGTLAFLFLYQVFGQAADLLPLLFTGAVFGGVALSAVAPRNHGRRAVSIGIAVFALSVAVNVATLSYRPPAGAEADATGFLERLDLRTMPPRAVIVADWARSTPLWYAKAFQVDRDDIDIINTDTGRWLERLEAMPGRPPFAAIPDTEVEDYRLVPYRNVHRLLPFE